MKYKMLCGFAVFAFAVAVTPAQTNLSMSGTCSKPDVMQSVPAGDRDGHVFTVAQGKCTTKHEMNGAMSQGGAFSEHGEVSGSHSMSSGVYVETFDSGDKIFYNYHGTETMKGDAMVTASNKWQITGGTGKMKGIKGSGNCKFTPAADGASDYTCTGEYTQAAAAPAKKK